MYIAFDVHYVSNVCNTQAQLQYLLILAGQQRYSQNLCLQGLTAIMTDLGDLADQGKR
jgi:hypothetical protein